MHFAIDRIDDGAKVFSTFMEAVVIDIHDEQFAFIVGADPCFVTLVKALEVVDADTRLVVASAFGDLAHEVLRARPQVDHQVWRNDGTVHVLEEPEVVLEIARGHQPHRMQVRSEDVRVLVDRSILYHVATTTTDLQQLLKATVQKENLQVEAPTRHVLVEIEQVWVVVHRFFQAVPLVVLGQKLRERGFPGANVACYRDVHDDRVPMKDRECIRTCTRNMGSWIIRGDVRQVNSGLRSQRNTQPTMFLTVARSRNHRRNDNAVRVVRV